MSNTVRSSRLARPVRVLLAAAVVLAVAAAGFVAGWQMRPSAEAERLAEATELDVWSPLGERVMGKEESFPGKASAGETRDIFLPAGGEDTAVVLEMSVQPGQALAAGQPLAIVSGKPYFALTEPLALYRNLNPGDTGKDVSSLQTALREADEHKWVTVSGVVDYDTMQAVERMYWQSDMHLGTAREPVAEYELAWNARQIQVEAFVPVPAGAVVIGTSAAGQTLDSEHPLLKVRIGNPLMEARVDVLSADELAVGDEVIVEVEGKSHPAKIAVIGEFQPATGDNEKAGKNITVELVDGDAEISDGALGRVVIGAGNDEPVLAVPLTAIRTNAEGAEYIVVRDSDSAEPREVTISVDRTGGGYAAVSDSSEDLRAGLQVKVS